MYEPHEFTRIPCCNRAGGSSGRTGSKRSVDTREDPGSSSPALPTTGKRVHLDSASADPEGHDRHRDQYASEPTATASLSLTHTLQLQAVPTPPPGLMTVVATCSADSTDSQPKIKFGVVQHTERLADTVDGVPQWRIRLADLKPDLTGSCQVGTAYRLQIGASYPINLARLTFPIDYHRDESGRYIIYTTAREVHGIAHAQQK